MENNEGEDLKNLLKGKGLQMGELAIQLGMSRQNLNYHLRKTELDGDFRRLIKEKLKINFPLPYTVSDDFILNDPEAKYKVVALYGGELEGGTSLSLRDNPDYIEGYIQMPGIGLNDGSWIVTGHSMHPTISKGCRVVIRKLENLGVIAWNEIYVVDLKEHGPKVKRIRKGPTDESYTLISDNKEYDPFVVSNIDILGIYRVLMTLEKF